MLLTRAKKLKKAMILQYTEFVRPSGLQLSNTFACKYLRQRLVIAVNPALDRLTSYFKHMTAFSLFHRPTFHIKLSSISPPLHVQALLASMFAVSIRFEDSRTGSRSLDHALTSDKFHKLSQRLVDEALLECEDETPPLCLLQALILVTFQQLIESVRGRSWRRLGTCIRIAYELQLHLVDKSRHPNSPSSENGCLEEEKRRAWWTIWEFDVYASTIRRLPTAIDWRYNVTWLPIHDDLWFANETAESCRLDLDPAVAWKLLQKTGNTSPRAWFIVVNALMRTAQLLSYPQVFSDATRRDSASSGQDSETLNTIANSLYCFSSALPPNLLYRGEFLRFEPDDPDSFQRDSGKHCIYIMIQLTKFMINHHQVFESASRLLSLINATTSETPQQPQLSPADQAAWNHYLSAASEIVGLVRDCSPKHVIYVNPFLANTIWLAAAAQVVSKAFAPILVDRRTAESNLDVLKLNLNAYVSIWGSSNSQSQKLTTLETRLNNSRGQAGNSEKQPLATSIQTDTFENATRRTDVSGNSRLTDSTSLNIASDEPSMAANQGLPLMDWSYPQGFNLDWPTPGNQLGSDLWGWYSDEILMSGTLE